MSTWSMILGHGAHLTNFCHVILVDAQILNKNHTLRVTCAAVCELSPRLYFLSSVKSALLGCSMEQLRTVHKHVAKHMTI